MGDSDSFAVGRLDSSFDGSIVGLTGSVEGSCGDNSVGDINEGPLLGISVGEVVGAVEAAAEGSVDGSEDEMIDNEAEGFEVSVSVGKSNVALLGSNDSEPEASPLGSGECSKVVGAIVGLCDDSVVIIDEGSPDDTLLGSSDCSMLTRPLGAGLGAESLPPK